MPVFMKIDGIDSVGRQDSVKDGTSNTLMIGEHVLASVSHSAPDVLDELFYSPETAGGGVSVLEFSVENVPNNSPSPAPGESISFQGFGIDRGHMGGSSPLVFPTQTAFPEVSGWNIEQDVIELSPDQAVSVIAIIAPVDLNEVDVGHASLLFSENAPGGAWFAASYIRGENSPASQPRTSHSCRMGPFRDSFRRFVPGKHSIRAPLVFSNRFCRVLPPWRAITPALTFSTRM